MGKGRIPRVIVKFEPIIETCLSALTAAFTWSKNIHFGIQHLVPFGFRKAFREKDDVPKVAVDADKDEIVCVDGGFIAKSDKF